MVISVNHLPFIVILSFGAISHTVLTVISDVINMNVIYRFIMFIK